MQTYTKCMALSDTYSQPNLVGQGLVVVVLNAILFKFSEFKVPCS